MEETKSVASFFGLLGGGVIGLILLLYFGMFGCNRITPTEVGFKISNSGDYRGLDTLPTETGYVFTQPGFNYIVKMPTTQQHVVWSKAATEGNLPDQEIMVSCQGGAGFSMDVGFNYRINPYKASKIYLKYRTDDLERITQTYLRNVVRGAMQDVSGTITVDSMLNSLPTYEKSVRENLKSKLEPEGFMVDLFQFLNKPVPTDENLAKSINAKISAKQDAETSKMQLQQSVAEANKEIATAHGDSSARMIRAHAEANEIELKNQQLEHSGAYVEYLKAQRWDGKLPQYMTGSSGTLFNLK